MLKNIERSYLIDYLLKPSQYSSDSIVLPNAIISFWVSAGFPFHIVYDIYTKEGINKLAFWWLGNQYVLKEIKYELIEYFLQYHQKQGISTLMLLIWGERPDLQKTFPQPKDEDSRNFKKWWLLVGLQEYNIPYIKEDYKLLLNFIWEDRLDLQKKFPDPENLNKDEFKKWWLLSGLREYNIPYTKEDYKLLLQFIWQDRLDLQKVFPDPKNSDKDEFKKWWLLYGIKEYGILVNSKLESKEIEKQNNSKIKIAFIGHHSGIFGLGEDARLIVESLSLAGFEVDSYIANPNIMASKEKVNAKNLEDYTCNYLINIFCLPAFDMIGLAFEYGLNLFTSSINIGIWQWELRDFPKEAEFAFKLIHKPIGISTYTSKSFEHIFNKKVDTIPLPLKEYKFEKKDRGYFGLPDKSFMFYFSFDRNSFIDRKNPLGPIEAFQNAFIDEDVILVIKVMGSVDSQIWTECKRRAYVDKRIFIIEKTLNKNDYLALLDLSDAVISLHRAEGFGRLLAEAFLLEKPVIVSNYSGNLDYTKSENSYLINGMEIPTFPNEYLFSRNNFWFQPSTKESTNIMRYIYNNPEEAISKAKKGRERIRKDFSLNSTSLFLKEIIDKLIKKDIDEE
jgi:glycosyltransferase involved in cell wall biosynthesis